MLQSRNLKVFKSHWEALFQFLIWLCSRLNFPLVFTCLFFCKTNAIFLNSIIHIINHTKQNWIWKFQSSWKLWGSWKVTKKLQYFSVHLTWSWQNATQNPLQHFFASWNSTCKFFICLKGLHSFNVSQVSKLLSWGNFRLIVDAVLLRYDVITIFSVPLQLYIILLMRKDTQFLMATEQSWVTNIHTL